MESIEDEGGAEKKIDLFLKGALSTGQHRYVALVTVLSRVQGIYEKTSLGAMGTACRLTLGTSSRTTVECTGKELMQCWVYAIPNMGRELLQPPRTSSWVGGPSSLQPSSESHHHPGTGILLLHSSTVAFGSSSTALS